MRLLKVLIPFAFIFLLVACSSTPVTGKKAFLVIPEHEELSMGEQAWSDIKRKERVTKDLRVSKMVLGVGKNIAAYANRPDFKWEIQTFESTQPNAFCLPGGKIGIYTGILKYAQNEPG